MPSHHRKSSSCNSVSDSNLFVESDPWDVPRPAAVAHRRQRARRARHRVDR